MRKRPRAAAAAAAAARDMEDRGDDGELEEEFPGRLLHVAALWDNAELLEDLLRGEHLQYIDCRDSWGRTALHAAAMSEGSRCLEALLRSGADAGLECGPRGQRRTALHVCAEHGHAVNAEKLLGLASQGSALLEARDAAGLTPLELAEKNKNARCCEVLRRAIERYEQECLEKHGQLRLAVLQADCASARAILQQQQQQQQQQDQVSQAELKRIQRIVNLAPNGSNTLLFLASETGQSDMVRLLLDSGADCTIHPVTRYSPLYIACYNGHQQTVNLLLNRFPELAQSLTVERWLPAHAAAINGHHAIVELLIKFGYPPQLYQRFRDSSGELEYEMPFDINGQDVTDQNILYISSVLGNLMIVELLLGYRVRARVVKDGDAEPETATATEPTAAAAATATATATAAAVGKRRISSGIQRLMSSLNFRLSSDGDKKSKDENLICPLKLDLYCNNGTETALHAAVRSGHAEIVAALLQAGADPNLPLRASTTSVEDRARRVDDDDETENGHDEDDDNDNDDDNAGANGDDEAFRPDRESARVKANRLGTASICSALALACRNKDQKIAELLLQHGATDNDCSALRIAARNGDELLTARLLSIKAHPDSEYKINKKALSEAAAGGLASSFGAVGYSALLGPSTPVTINWHDQQCRLSRIRPQWLLDAVLHVNRKLSRKNVELALYAITRLDVSRNSIASLPSAVFYLQSLRYLNVAQNKIEVLTAEPKSQRVKLCPVLEEIYLQDNRLEQLPDFLMDMPALEIMDVSNNKLQRLPDNLWRAPKLKELNASFNLLRELPTGHQHYRQQQQQQQQQQRNNAAKQTSANVPRSSECPPDYPRLAGSQSFRSLAAQLTLPREQSADDDAYFSNISNARVVDMERPFIWSKSVRVMEKTTSDESEQGGNKSLLASLNLAHNLFTSIPVTLPCLAVSLVRLNMAYNSLRSMGHITSYPSSLKQLDLSNNQISCWPSLPQIDGADETEQASTACYCPVVAASATGGLQSPTAVPTPTPSRQNATSSLRDLVLASVCAHRRHLRLENLRTLVLANNALTRIQLTSVDDGETSTAAATSSSSSSSSSPFSSSTTPATTYHLHHHLYHHHSSDDYSSEKTDPSSRSVQSSKMYLLFPNVSMLDVSNNRLKEIPTNIYELGNLSVLNVSGNCEINELPPHMGLLSRLWNLNTQGCNLQEPLKSMIESKKYKTMDVIGYLKSVLEDAKPYARMKLMIVGIQGIGKTSLLEQLRQEGEVPSKKKSSADHWAKRMGNKNINSKTTRGTTISTVGVDIADWIYEKKVRGQSSHGPVYFRTWDFGGQREYYVTHQYFLSKRSLYLVVWRIIDGFKGVNEIFQWLVNIQSRAPNSPVIIVGTHYDIAYEQSEILQQYIRDKFINVVDAEKCGLPRVMETIEISCKTRHNIKMLCNLIYDVVFSLRSPGSKELLLEQRVPSSYLALEDVVVQLANERRARGADPVLKAEQYHSAVCSELQKMHKSFRDPAELHQATMFLHDNGIILHYDDATLKDLYFLDPQWLCDMLAHVITIREINPFARSGIMKLDDIQHVFKSSTISSAETQGYVVSLLNKFEVALTWDYRTLLIPSLLPTEDDMLRHCGSNLSTIEVPVKSRGWHPLSSSSSPCAASTSAASGIERVLTSRPQPDCSVIRLLLMSYFPSGFWSRLITRILADDTIAEIVMSFLTPFKDFVDDKIYAALMETQADWRLWQTGIELRYAGVTLLRLKEIDYSHKNSPYDYRQYKFKLKQDGIWCNVDLKSTAILEIWFPVDTLVIKQPIISHDNEKKGDDDEVEEEEDEPIGYQAIVVEPRPETMPQLLALIVDHIDILLEDWYPTLGTRFVHTSEGKLLVTRLIPCPRCLIGQTGEATEPERDVERAPVASDGEPFGVGRSAKQERQSQDSYKSCKSDGDSGIEHDSRQPSLEGHPECRETAQAQSAKLSYVYGWMVEECILAAYGKRCIECPRHAEVSLSQVAPDIIFMDLGARHLVRPEDVRRGKMLGRGAFGFVFRGTCRPPSGRQSSSSSTFIDVAMKMLQPVPPGPNARQSALLAYKAAQSKWDRDPLQYACKAYCTARQELNILLTLRHPNIVPLVGIVISPLALVLDLAPEGALNGVLRSYRRSGAHLDPYVLQAVVLQVAKALEYLHQQHVIYRDLKSENVLVWRMPQPFEESRSTEALLLASSSFSTSPSSALVHVKLADYGISRQTLPSGAKGFGGTEGFMAPEIIRYNGEEEYTEKVDSFSFGMFIYELVALRQPFEGHESVKECILEGGRPSLSYTETLHPSHVLDLMVICWAQNPKDRPTASQIVSIASAPEFTHLVDVTLLTETTHVTAITMMSRQIDENTTGNEIWLGHNNGQVDMLLGTDKAWLQHVRIDTPVVPFAMCSVDGYIWIGDNTGQLHVYLGTNFGCVGKFRLEANLDKGAKIVALVYLEQLKHFAVALHSGRILLVANSFTQNLKTDLVDSSDDNIKTYSLAAVPRKRRIVELWAGRSFGRVTVYTLKDTALTDTLELEHVGDDTARKNLFATYLTGAENSVFSYTYPGCIVYQWDLETKQIVNKLDMSKLVPCSESLKSIAIEENLTTEKGQVTALETCRNQLYIGTTWGCIVVAECNSLRPITVFRPFEGKVSQIIAFKSVDKRRLIMATVGQGYRSLISRYTDYLVDCLEAEDLRHNMYVLLWRSEHWSAA